MAERPKAAVLKTVGHASAPWVRILLPPPNLTPRRGGSSKRRFQVSGFRQDQNLTLTFVRPAGGLPFARELSCLRLGHQSLLTRNSFLLDDLVDLFPVNDPEDQDVCVLHSKHHPVVADAEFPVSFQSSSEGLAVFLRCREESCFYGLSYPCGNAFVKLRDIFRFDGWMVLEYVFHISPIRPRGRWLFSHRNSFPVVRRMRQGPDPREARSLP